MKRVIRVIGALAVIVMGAAFACIMLLLVSNSRLSQVYMPYTGILGWFIIGLMNLDGGIQRLDVARKQGNERRWYSENKFLYGLFGLSLGLFSASLQIMSWFAPGDSNDMLVYSVTAVPLAFCLVFLALIIRNAWQKRRIQQEEQRKQRKTA